MAGMNDAKPKGPESTLSHRLLKMMPRSLWLQTLTLLGISLVGSTLTVAPLGYARFREDADTDLLKHGQTLTQTLEQHSELRLAATHGDSGPATALLTSIAASDEEITYVALLNGNRQLIAFAPKKLQRAELLDILGKQIVGAETLHDAEHNVYRFTRRMGPGQDVVGEALALGGSPAIPDDKVLGYVALGLSDLSAATRVRGQTTGAVVAMTLILFNVFILLHMRWVTRRVYDMVSFARGITDGDLTQSLPDVGDDDLGRLGGTLQMLSSRNNEVVRELATASSALSIASTELLSAASSHAASASTQAGSVAEMGATVSELRETFSHATNKAETVIDLARRSEESSSGGADAVRDSIDEMSHIRDQVAAIAHTIRELVQRTDQIDAIIEVVTDLAEQSNVLALNAGIEAAKAAEYGRGFGVVAREVRSLAERSKESTSQIKLILQDIQRAGRDAIHVIEEGNRRAESGANVARAAGVSIERLGEAIAASSAAAMQIATSTRQQSLGVDQIWQATQEIDRVANETASGIAQIESAAGTSSVCCRRRWQVLWAPTKCNDGLRAPTPAPTRPWPNSVAAPTHLA